MIIVDINEAVNHDKIVGTLQRNGIDVEVRPLGAGDYCITGPNRNILVERKAAGDFAASLQSKRLFQQMDKMKNTEDVEPRILIEGYLETVFDMTRMHPAALYAAVANVTERWHIPIYWTTSLGETAMLLVQLHRQINKDNEKCDFSLRVHKRSVTPEATVRYILEGLPHVGPKTAQTLLTKFGSIQGILKAKPNDLKTIPGIGKKTAEQLYEVLHYGET